jgi:hypothetical protein
MKLYYSKIGIPYIETEGGDKLIFSVSTENKELGFKWIAFSGTTTETIPLSAGSKGKNKGKVIKLIDRVSFISDIGLSSITKKTAGNTNTPYASIMSLKKMMDPMIVNGYFNRKNLSKLEELLNSEDFMSKEDLLDEDPMGYIEDEEGDENNG